MTNKFNVGDKVRMKGNRMRCAMPEYCPDCTVIGEVVKVYGKRLLVNWGEDSGTLYNHEGFVGNDWVTKVEE